MERNFIQLFLIESSRSPYDVVANVPDYEIVVKEFEL